MAQIEGSENCAAFGTAPNSQRNRWNERVRRVRTSGANQLAALSRASGRSPGSEVEGRLEAAPLGNLAGDAGGHGAVAGKAETLPPGYGGRTGRGLRQLHAAAHFLRGRAGL